MFALIIKLLVTAVAVMIAAYLLEGVTVKNFGHALLTAVLLAVANAFLEPILNFFGAPLIWITFGLFSWVISAVILMIVDAVLPGLKIKNFWWALGFAVVLAILTWLLNIFVPG